MNILVTGGAGYIGSHTCVELLKEGHSVIVLDNLSNSSEKSLERVRQITGKEIAFYCVDLLDKVALDDVFEKHSVDAVIHFAGLKAVAESVEKPLEYYNNNLTGTLNLCASMREHGVKNLIFSSSATVYGESEVVPVTESCEKKRPTNPYGMTKWMLEEILIDLQKSDSDWNVILLRYFNPIGAHESGLIGEDPNGIPNNLVPYIAQVAIGRRPHLNVFGNDYNTPDGTCIRDYIHVVDLALGHVKALSKLKEKCGVRIYNLGTGIGYSVLEVVHAFEAACGKKLPYVFANRRDGDLVVSYSDPSLAKEELGWEAKRDIATMCADSWRWQKMNPNGYTEG